MDVLTTPADMTAWSNAQRSGGHRIVVVPTMGALHAGHMALIEAAFGRGDRVIVTLFVNPLQFNQSTDFAAYPRPIDSDLERCRAAGVHAAYAPTAAAMYPPGFQTHVEPGELADRLEGPMRPGHFRGVTTVVAKLFGATRPDVAMFGEKDFQQLAIVRRMVLDLDLGVEIEGVPIVREPDGLALSSRNVRLTPADRAAAVVISQGLGAAADAHAAGRHAAAELRDIATGLITAEPRARLDYVEVVDPTRLEPVESTADGAVILAAVWFGDVRLIDNRVLAP